MTDSERTFIPGGALTETAALRKPRAERQQSPRAQRVPGLLESHIQQTVTEFLQLDGWRAFRTELTVQRERGRVVGERGQPDYLYVRYRFTVADTEAGFLGWNRNDAEVWWIEFKRPGEKPRPDQLAWHEAERKRGALVMVVDDIDQFVAFYKTSGLQRR